MMWITFALSLILWIYGIITSHTFDGFIYLLLVVALAIVLIWIDRKENNLVAPPLFKDNLIKKFKR